MRSTFSNGLPKSFLAMAIAIVCLLTHSVSADVIYQDDFSGTAGTDLGGTTPDIGANPWVTANSRGDTGAALVFGADGTIAKDGPNSSHDAGALLPFAIAANTTYTLEASFVNNNSSWVAVGFASSDGTLDGSNGRHSNGGAGAFGGYAWGLTRNNAGNDQEFFSGIGTGAGGFASGDLVDPTANVDFRIVLNTADTNAITADYFLNGTQFGATQTLAASAFGDISFVGLSSDGNAGDGTASISSFSLTSVPEPSSLVFLGMGAIGLFARRRKR